MRELEVVKKAGRSLLNLNREKVNIVLLSLAEAVEASMDKILQSNKKDLAKMDKSDPKYDRLLLNKERLLAIARDIRNVASLPSPLGIIYDKQKLKSGIERYKITVPIGVIGIIYESRPNVTFDLFSLCFKSGNALVLKGGSDAIESNKAAVELIHEALEKHGLAEDIVHLLGVGREAA